MQTVIDVAHLLARRWRALLGFELLFQGIVLSLVGPALKLTLDGVMALGGFAYLTWENLCCFALTPACIVCMLVWAALFTLVTVFELVGAYYVLAADIHTHVGVMDAMRYALRRTLRAARPANIPLIPYLLLFVPFLHIGIVAVVVHSLSLPEFIMEQVQMNPMLGVGYAVTILALAVCVLLFAPSVVYFVADDVTFVQAARMGRAASRHHVLGDGLRVMVVVPVLVTLVSLALFLPILAILAVTGRLWLWLGIFNLLSVAVGLLAYTPLSVAMLLEALGSRNRMPPAPAPPVARAPVWAAPTIVGITLIASMTLGAYFVCHNYVMPAQAVASASSKTTVVTGHRGGAIAAPENTMAAFRQAKEDGADVCELDVQQSSDGVIFVSHDSNFKRISGVDKGSWELTWDEICRLDAAGKRWQGTYEPQSYPTLDEVLAWAAQNDMLLNIELKPTGHEKDFEKAVVDIVTAHGFKNRCIMTSQAYETVKRIKEYAPDATCAYVMRLAYGDICQLDAADVFSVQEISATPALVAYLHARDKTVLAWVVNSRSSIMSMASNGVDNVITDDVSLGRQVVDEATQLSPIERLFNSIVAILE